MPKAKIIWLFRQRLTDAGLIEAIFARFNQYLNTNGYQAQDGQIIDATIIPAPVQHNSTAEHESIKNGEIPAAWAEKPHKQAQKDTDARWTQKNGENYFGNKNHIDIDIKYGFIHTHTVTDAVTDASVHDSQVFSEVLDWNNEGDAMYADSAYRSQVQETALEGLGFDSQIHERAYRNRPLSGNFTTTKVGDNSATVELAK